MTVNIIIPSFALLLFMMGIWMGSMVNPLFGLLAVLGGLLLGFTASFKMGLVWNNRSRLLLLAAFIFLLGLMSLAYLVIIQMVI